MDLVLTHSRDPKSFLKKKKEKERKEKGTIVQFLLPYIPKKILVRLLQTTKEFLFVILVYGR